MKKIIIIYGCDSIDGKTCGPETIGRIEGAISFLKRSVMDSFMIILSVGLRPSKPEYPPLKEVMKSYLMERLGKEKLLSRVEVIISSLDGWRTLKESISAKNEIDMMASDGSDIMIYLCSSLYHLPRVKFIWKMMRRKDDKLRYITTIPVLAGSLYSVLREVPAWIRLMVELFLIK